MNIKRQFAKFLAIGLLALVTASDASAQLNIYIVGSNGDRTPTQKAIQTLLEANGSWSFQGNRGRASNSSFNNALNSNFGAWNGTYKGTNVVIRTSFIGAVGAVRSLAGLVPERYVVANGSGTNSTPDIYATNATYGGPNGYTTNLPNIALSTVFQATTPYSGEGYDTLSETQVGVSPIVFVASPGSPLTNITSQQAQSLFTAGYLTAAQFTGVASDANKIIFALGRNYDAGQRFAVLAETGIGTATTVNHWLPSVTGATTNAANIVLGGRVTNQALWPREIISGNDSVSLGNGGYATGAQLATALTITNIQSSAIKDTFGFSIPGASSAFYVGYITTGDYNTTIATNGPGGTPVATLLSYNGIPFSTNNLINGSYTSWVYNRVLERSDARNTGGTLSHPTIAAFKDDLVNTITTTTGNQNGGILIGDLKVGRTADGGIVTQN